MAQEMHDRNIGAGEKRARVNTKRLTTLAMLAGMAYAVLILSKLIPINVLGFLNFDLKDVVIAIGGFIYGPLAAASLSLVVSLIEMVTISDTGLIGLIMNVLSTCAFACTAAYLYHRRRTQMSAVVGLALGILAMTAMMLLWNYLITPYYMHVAREDVVALLMPVFLPFNLIKAGINATLTILLYKPVVKALRRARLMPAATPGAGSGGGRLAVTLAAAVLLVTFVLLALVMAGII